MSFDHWILLVGGLLLLMALCGTLLKRLPVSTAMVYLGVGAFLGPGLGALRLEFVGHAEALERLTEVVVLVSLFTTGIKMRTSLSQSRWKLPLTLATITMMLTILAVAGLGVALFTLPLGAALLLGGVLAPTDPVLASEVQVEGAEDKDRLRFSLTGEAGLNDGTAFPFVLLGLGLLGHHDLGGGWRWLAVDVVWGTACGLGVGWAMGYGVARTTLFLRRQHEHARGMEEFLALGLIGASYGVAHVLHGYGFLATFAAALSMRHYEMAQTGEKASPTDVRRQAGDEAETSEEAAPAHMVEEVQGFGERLERISEMGMVVAVGALLGQADLSGRALLFVVLLLFAVRPLAVALSLLGSGRSPRFRRLVGWFGIRGVGSLYYLAYATTHGLAPDLARPLTGLVLTVVAASIVLHGTSATPLMQRYEAAKARRRSGHRAGART